MNIIATLALGVAAYGVFLSGYSTDVYAPLCYPNSSVIVSYPNPLVMFSLVQS